MPTSATMTRAMTVLTPGMAVGRSPRSRKGSKPLLKPPIDGLDRALDRIDLTQMQSKPRVSVRCRQHGVDFRPRQEAHQLFFVPFARHRQHALDGSRMGGVFERRLAEEGPDGGETQIAAAGAIATPGLQAVEKGADHRGI